MTAKDYRIDVLQIYMTDRLDVCLLEGANSGRLGGLRCAYCEMNDLLTDYANDELPPIFNKVAKYLELVSHMKPVENDAQSLVDEAGRID